MTIVNHTLIDGESNPVAHAYVEVRLLSPTQQSFAYSEDRAQFVSRVVKRTDLSGDVSFDLTPNDTIMPAGSVYQFIWRVEGFLPTPPVYFNVPVSGPVNLADHLRTAPDDIPPGAALVGFDPGDSGMSSHDAQAAIVEAFERGGGSRPFPTFFQQDTPTEQVDGDTWMRWAGTQVSAYPNYYGVRTAVFNVETGAWIPIVPAAIDPDTHKAIGIISVGEDGNIVIERFDTDGSPLANVAIVRDQIYLRTTTGSINFIAGDHELILGADDGAPLLHNGVDMGTPLVPVDTGDPNPAVFSFTQGAVTFVNLTGSYFKGIVRQIESNQWLVDGWGHVALQDGDAGPIVLDLSPLIVNASIGNEIRALDGMPIGHAGGTIGGSPAEYLHLAYSPDDGPCCVRLVDLDGNEISTPTVNGDVLQIQLSMNTWDD